MQSLDDFLKDDDTNRYGPDTSTVRRLILDWITIESPIGLNFKNYNIHTLPPLPDTVKELTIGNEHLVYIPVLPTFLEDFWCIDAYNVRKIPALPNTLKYLNISNTQIVCIPTLGCNIERIIATNTPIRKLPYLYDGIEVLGLSGTKISKIPGVVLPDTLFELNVSNTNITTLPRGGRGLMYLYIHNTKISELPVIPYGLEILTAYRCDNLIIPYNGYDNLRQYMMKWDTWRETGLVKERIISRCNLIKEELCMNVCKDLNIQGLPHYKDILLTSRTDT